MKKKVFIVMALMFALTCVAKDVYLFSYFRG